ncbi:MAG: efflux RND transporter periplasmic adaptor subunit [Candidatus Sericytochromatia bacterium]|nr:efflux RND transporter periplasmic adaptor subunit [Candidatus Sericytochromatia bacterium]
MRHYSAGITVLAVLILTACRSGSDAAPVESAAPAVSVHTAVVQQVTLDHRLALPATVMPLSTRSSVVSATATARVLSLTVRPGDLVRSGQLIGTLAADPNVAADLRKAEVAVMAAQREAQRQRRLLDVGVTTRAQLDQAMSAEATAAADVQAKTLALHLARNNTSLRVPIGGTVTAVNTFVGATADLATPLVTVVDLAQVGVQAELAAEGLSGLQVGTVVTIEAPPGLPLTGRVTALPPSVDPATQRARLWVEAANPGLRLRLGQFVTVSVPQAATTVLAVPTAAVVMRQAGQVVYEIVAGKAVERAVILRATDQRDRMAVVSGLRAGAVVALDADPLSDGIAVRIESPPAK